MSTNFQFTMMPRSILSRILSENLTKTDLKTLLCISEQILSFSDTRETLTRELSCRYLQQIIKIHFSHIAKSIKKLEALNFIQVIKKGTEKTGGSIIKLILPNKAETATDDKKQVAESATKETKPDLKKITIPEKTLIQGEKLFKGAPEEIVKKETSRILSFLNEKSEKIQNPIAYFISCCKISAKSISQNLQSAAKIEQGKETVKKIIQEQEEIEKIQEGEIDWMQRVEELKRTYPEEMKKTIQQVEIENRGKSIWKYTFPAQKAEIYYNRFYNFSCANENYQN